MQTTNKTILILGASGPLGRVIAARFPQEGYKVNSITRNLSKVPNFKEGTINWTEGRIEDRSSLRKAAYGCSGIIVCVGVQSLGKTTIYTDAVENLVPVMKELKIERIMMVTTEKDNDGIPWWKRKILFKMLKEIFLNQIEAEKALKNLNDPEIKWTVARLSHFTDEPYTGGLLTRENNSNIEDSSFTTPKSYAAEFFVNELFSERWENKFVAVTKEKSPSCFC